MIDISIALVDHKIRPHSCSVVGSVGSRLAAGSLMFQCLVINSKTPGYECTRSSSFCDLLLDIAFWWSPIQVQVKCVYRSVVHLCPPDRVKRLICGVPTPMSY